MPPSPLDESAGAFLIATCLSTYATGITTAQAFEYFRNCRTNEKIIYWTVFSLLIFDWIHSLFAVLTPYGWLVTNYGDPSVLSFTPYSFNLELAQTGIVATIVQGYFAYKIFLLSKSKLVIPIIICVGSIIQLGFSFAVTIEAFILKDFSRFETFTWGVVTWLVLAAVVDIIITISMLYYLRGQKSDYVKTNNLVDSIILNIIRSGSLSTFVAVVNAIVFAIMPSKGWFAIPNLLLSKLYFNSLLVSLNSRQDLRNQISEIKLGVKSDRNSQLEQYFGGRMNPVRVEMLTETRVEEEDVKEDLRADRFTNKSRLSQPSPAKDDW